MSTLDRAIIIAVQAHTGQTDKGGAPYILHPLRIMLKLSSNEERSVAVLHDVVEDTDWTLERLRAEGFSEQVLRAIDSVTHRDGEAYEEFVRRAADDPIGRRVKIADLEDNLDLSRVKHVTDRDRARGEKYRRALQILLDAD